MSDTNKKSAGGVELITNDGKTVRMPKAERLLRSKMREREHRARREYYLTLAKGFAIGLIAGAFCLENMCRLF